MPLSIKKRAPKPVLTNKSKRSSGGTAGPNRLIVTHIKPEPGANSDLELITFHIEDGRVGERNMSLPFYEKAENPAYQLFLDEIDCAKKVYKITDEHGISLKNEKNYEIKLFVKPLDQDMLGEVDADVFNSWFRDTYLVALHKYVGNVKSWNVPIYDPTKDYFVKHYWSDMLGERKDQGPAYVAEDIRELVQQDYRDEEVPFRDHNFSQWLTQNGEKGSRYYALFRPGYLTPEEIVALGIPESVLQGEDLANFKIYTATLNSLDDGSVTDSTRVSAVSTFSTETPLQFDTLSYSVQGVETAAAPADVTPDSKPPGDSKPPPNKRSKKK
jgi:hypothetical protein